MIKGNDIFKKDELDFFIDPVESELMGYILGLPYDTIARPLLLTSGSLNDKHELPVYLLIAGKLKLQRSNLHFFKKRWSSEIILWPENVLDKFQVRQDPFLPVKIAHRQDDLIGALLSLGFDYLVFASRRYSSSGYITHDILDAQNALFCEPLVGTSSAMVLFSCPTQGGSDWRFASAERMTIALTHFCAKKEKL